MKQTLLLALLAAVAFIIVLLASKRKVIRLKAPQVQPGMVVELY